MRISDWSSDVCSSDLADGARRLLDEAMEAARSLTADLKGTLVHASAASLAGALSRLADLHEKAGRAGSHASPDRAVDTTRPDARRVGDECVSTCRYRKTPYHSQKTPHKH